MSQVVGNVCIQSSFRVPSTHKPLLQTALAYARVWHHVDASERVLGKLAERIAIVLMGKHKPIFDPSGTSGHSFKLLSRPIPNYL